MTVDEALEALRTGNARWANGTSEHPHEDGGTREALRTAQHPSVTVVSCSDSRVPPELVLDQGLGDLFTVRTAGQVLDEAALGSIVYAVEHLGVRLVVVLGHARCGAVDAAVTAVETGGAGHGHVGALVEAIRPAVRDGDDHTRRVADTVTANVARVVEQLTEDRELGEAAAKERPESAGGPEPLRVVGAVYDLDACAITWL